MSTRAQIDFYNDKEKELTEWKALIYKHSDGYPDGVLPLLTKFVNEFQNERGLRDAEYASAWYLYELIKEYDYTRFLGFGISKDFHGDIDYYYAVYPDRVEIWTTNNETPKQLSEVEIGGQKFYLTDIKII